MTFLNTPYVTSAIAVLLAYLMGSISFAVVVSHLMGLSDPRTYGSKNPGATNVLRSGNKAAAVITLLGDALKGGCAVWLAQHFAIRFGLTDITIALVALAVFLGHLYPVFFKFKGGKGVATAAGVIIALHWGVGLATVATWLLMALLFRYSSLAALSAALFAPLAYGMVVNTDIILFAILIMSALLIYRHSANIGNLLAGKESKLGSKKTNQSVKQAVASSTHKNRPSK